MDTQSRPAGEPLAILLAALEPGLVERRRQVRLALLAGVRPEQE